MRRVLITGATGGLGLALTSAFSGAGYAVTATGRSESPRARLESLGAAVVIADLTDPGIAFRLCEGQDVVVHAAALSASWGAPGAFHAANVMVTENLLTAARSSGCSGFIYISSPSIYAAMQDRFNLTEQSPVSAAPLNHYARTKLMAERLVLAQNTNRFRTCALRPRGIVGPDDKVLLPRLMALVKEGRLPLFRDGRAMIELTDVRDAARAALLADRRWDDVQGQAINISGGKSISVKDLACNILRVTGLTARFVNIPMPVAALMARVLEWLGICGGYTKEPRLTRYSLATLAYAQTFDATKARELLGFIPQHDAVNTILECAGSAAK